MKSLAALRSKLFKSSHDYSRFAIAAIAGFLFVYSHHGGDVDKLVDKGINMFGSASLIWALVVRSPRDDD